MRLGRKLGALLRGDPGLAETDDELDEPCIPCGDQRGVRQFSLNPAPARELHDGTRPDLSPGQQYAAVDGQLVLYDPSRPRTHVLNGSAALIWATVDGQRTVAEIIDALVADTGAERSVIEADTRRTVADFLDLGILIDEPPPTLLAARPDRAARWAPALARALDRHPWRAVVGPVRAAGVDVVVRTDEPTLARDLTAMLAALPPATPSVTDPAPDSGTEPAVLSVRDAGPARHPRYRLYTGGRRGWSTNEAGRLLELTATELNQIAIGATAERYPGWLLLHAGAVERHGRVIAVTGDSGRGKSTLTARLVQRGWSYLTDELASIDPQGLDVLAYPRALDLDAGSRRLLGLPDRSEGPAAKDPIRPTDIGHVSVGGRLKLLVVLGDEPPDAGASNTTPTVRTLVDLIGVTFGRTFDDPSALAHLADLASRVAVLHLRRGPLDEMADRIEAAAAAAPTLGAPAGG